MSVGIASQARQRIRALTTVVTALRLNSLFQVVGTITCDRMSNPFSQRPPKVQTHFFSLTSHSREDLPVRQSI